MVRSNNVIAGAAFATKDDLSQVIALMGDGVVSAYATLVSGSTPCSLAIEVTPDGQNWIEVGAIAVTGTPGALANTTVTVKAIQTRLRQKADCALAVINAWILN
jgi:hypothetical protein